MAVKLKKLYEGKAKIIYAKTSKEVIATYKNDATAFNNLKKGSIKNKGAPLFFIEPFFKLLKAVASFL